MDERSRWFDERSREDQWFDERSREDQTTAMSCEATLAAVAFGEDPGRWPLPSATTPQQRWLRSVAAGGQGRYGCAASELSALRRDMRSGALASLAHSTQASFLRQLGGHSAARQWDGRALALAASDLEATLDALVGLAADALGIRRFAASTALLRRAEALLAAPSAPPRLRVRSQWVAAELAMVRGDGVAAVRHAERAVELAAPLPSRRHQVKTQVVYAAALCSNGAMEAARTVADDTLSETARLNLVPLRWATASLLADIGSDVAGGSDIVAIRDACAEAIHRAGGAWRR